MRKDQIAALLQHAKINLKKIETQYQQSLDEKIVSTSLQIDIKNMMENLRSSLDYLAHDIYEEVIMPARKLTWLKELDKVYFPYGKNENDFKSRIGASLPNLGWLHPIIYTLIENLQFHKSGDNWLYQFCEIVNEKKHNTLTPQTREESRSLDILFSGGWWIFLGKGATITGNGIIQTGTGTIHINWETISGNFPAKNITGEVNQKVTCWVSFKFTDSDIEVLPFLQKGLNTTMEFSEKVYSQLI